MGKNKLTYLAIFLFLIVFSVLSCYAYKKFYLYPIDLVYTWVDGNDENWRKEWDYWRQKNGANDPYAVSEARIRDREELLHSLRSVELYLPWVRNIYIVTYNQIPKWLNTSNPKIKIIDHNEIFPKDAMPVFNSIAIENVLVNIPGLSEHFIFSNDDFFVNKPLTPDFFFNQKGHPKFYFDVEYNKKYMLEVKNRPDSIFANLYKNANKVFQNKLKVGKSEMLYYTNTHNMQGYCKSDIKKISKIFANELRPSIYSKFRSASDLNVLDLTLAYEYVKKKLEVIEAHNGMEKYGCGVAGLLIMSSFERMKEDPCLFCLNDYQEISQATIDAHINYLRKRFPDKSVFEK